MAQRRAPPKPGDHRAVEKKGIGGMLKGAVAKAGTKAKTAGSSVQNAAKATKLSFAGKKQEQDNGGMTEEDEKAMLFLGSRANERPRSRSRIGRRTSKISADEGPRRTRAPLGDFSQQHAGHRSTMSEDVLTPTTELDTSASDTDAEGWDTELMESSTHGGELAGSGSVTSKPFAVASIAVLLLRNSTDFVVDVFRVLHKLADRVSVLVFGGCPDMPSGFAAIPCDDISSSFLHPSSQWVVCDGELDSNYVKGAAACGKIVVLHGSSDARNMFADSKEDKLELLRLTQKSRTTFVTSGQAWRFHPLLLYAQERVQEESFGELQSISVENLDDGGLESLACALDAVLWLGGSLPRNLGAISSSSEKASDAVVLVTGELKSGPLFSIHKEPLRYRSTPARRITLRFHMGRIDLDLWEGEIWVESAVHGAVTEVDDRDAPGSSLSPELLVPWMARDPEEFPVKPEDALISSLLMEEVRDALETGAHRECGALFDDLVSVRVVSPPTLDVDAGIDVGD